MVSKQKLTAVFSYFLVWLAVKIIDTDRKNLRRCDLDVLAILVWAEGYTTHATVGLIWLLLLNFWVWFGG